MLVGQVHANELINANPADEIQKLVSKLFLLMKMKVLQVFSVNLPNIILRILPVVDDENKVIGVISIDAVYETD